MQGVSSQAFTRWTLPTAIDSISDGPHPRSHLAAVAGCQLKPFYVDGIHSIHAMNPLRISFSERIAWPAMGNFFELVSSSCLHELYD
jgi:hypothetical protein